MYKRQDDVFVAWDPFLPIFSVVVLDPSLDAVAPLLSPDFFFVSFLSAVLASEICARRPALARALSYPPGKRAPDPVVR